MLANGFYLRLAAGNLWRNRRMYGPYLAATALISGMVFIINNLIFAQSVRNLSYGGTVMGMFSVGIVVMIIFTVCYMLYINSFLIKRRKKEFGLYAVLGMERRHVARVILWENTALSLGGLGLGLVGGMVFGKIAFLVLMRLLDTAEGSVFTLSPAAVLVTALVFFGIFVLSTLYNLMQVRLANPIDLLHGNQKGEKRVRLPLPQTLLGAGMLGFAYWMAITVRNPAMALMLFWPAVILVIAATWLLFSGGSVFILGRLKASRRIYYRPGSFIAISGLIHRMKQNAAGLANICILSTMVMVTVSCCGALYKGQAVILAQQNPSDFVLTLRLPDKDLQQELGLQLQATAEAVAQEADITVERAEVYRTRGFTVMQSEGRLLYWDDPEAAFTADIASDVNYNLNIYLLEDFNRMMGLDAALAEGTVFLLPGEEVKLMDALPTREGALAVAEVFEDTPFARHKHSNSRYTVGVVVRDQAAADLLATSINPSMESANMNTLLRVDTDANQEAGEAYATALAAAARRHVDGALMDTDMGGSLHTDNIYTNRMESYGLYGGLLFLGVFFAILFLINTVLILYFKQISEGFDDAERFAILQKVGLSDEEVKSTINRQMLIVFLLPLGMALLHIAAASNMIRMMLATFMLTDFTITWLSILFTAIVFVGVYLVVYRLTARTYYRLVRW